MPTLARLLLFLCLLAGLAIGGMTALVTYFKPQPRQIDEAVPLDHRIAK